MRDRSAIFDQNYQAYCDRIAAIDFNLVKEKLGLEIEGDKLMVPLFNRRYQVSDEGIHDMDGNQADYVSSVIIAKYILLCPDQTVDDPQWVAFKDFKSISHLTNVNYFASDTERAIERVFSGRVQDLAGAGNRLGGIHHQMDVSYDLSLCFTALPRISLLMLFNDGDDEFPAKCTVLFQKHAEFYLDPESLAMTGGLLAQKLKAGQRHG